MTESYLNFPILVGISVYLTRESLAECMVIRMGFVFIFKGTPPPPLERCNGKLGVQQKRVRNNNNV